MGQADYLQGHQVTAREVLDGIKARLAVGVHPSERWTSWPELTMDSIIMHRVYDDQRRCVAECSSPDVAEVLAAAPTDVARLTGAVEAVLGLHKPVYVYEYDDMNGVFKVDDAGEQIEMETLCSECTGDSVLESISDCEYDAGDYHDETPWPCPTVAAIENALTQ